MANKKTSRSLLLVIALFGHMIASNVYAADGDSSTIGSMYNGTAALVGGTVGVTKQVGNFFWELSPTAKVLVLLGSYVTYKVIRHAKIDYRINISWPNGFKLFENPFKKAKQ